MRATTLLCFAALMLVCFPCYGWGGEDNDASTGFKADIYLGGGWEFSRSNLEPDDDNKRLGNLDQKGKTQNDALFVGALDLSYSFENGLTLFGGLLRAKESRPTLGLRYDLGKYGEVEVAGFYIMPEEAWEDPFLLGGERKKTTQTAYGGSLAYGLGDWQINYELAFVDVDKDLIGERYSELKRDGKIHLLGTEYEIELGNDFELAPSLNLAIADMDGKSNSYTGFGGGIAFTKRWNKVEFLLSFEAGNKSYNSRQPLFNKTRNDMEYEAMAMLSWYDPLGLKNYSLDFGCRYEKTDSNINFYDSVAYVPFLLIGYHFGGDND